MRTMNKNMVENFSPEEIRGGFDCSNKGHVIETKLTKAKDMTYIFGFVKGRGRGHYTVEVQIDADGDIDGDCNCMVEYNCKHVVAVVIAAGFGTDAPVVKNFPAIDFNQKLNPELSQWIDNVEKRPLLSETQELFFIFKKGYADYAPLIVETYTSRKLKNGQRGKFQPYYPSTLKKKAMLSVADLEILSLLKMFAIDVNEYNGEYRLSNRAITKVIKTLLATNRCYWKSSASPLLSEGEPLVCDASWITQTDGSQKLTCQLPESSEIFLLPTDPPHYVNVENATIGLIKINAPEEIAATLFNMPAIPPAQTQQFVEILKKKFGEQLNLPLPQVFDGVIDEEKSPKPHLFIYSYNLTLVSSDASPFFEYSEEDVILAEVSFYYDDLQVYSDEKKTEFVAPRGSKLARIQRNKAEEHSYLAQLPKEAKVIPLLEFRAARYAQVRNNEKLERSFYLSKMEDDNGFLNFKESIVPKLELLGWTIEYAEDLACFNFIEIDSWYADLNEESEYDWFGLELGVIIDDKKVNLLPYLIDSINNNKLKPCGEGVALTLPNMGVVTIPQDRIQRIMNVVTELFDPTKKGQSKSTLRLSRIRAGLLVEMQRAFAAAELRWFGGNQLRDLADRMSGFTSLKNATVPKAFAAVLRPYQQQAINWLQFLAEFKLNGILADDMGLGKTVQALAHIAIEKFAGRLTKPCLIVAPTSVVHNWQCEIEKFAPFLTSVVLQGDGRKDKFYMMMEQDIVLTTYPLLVRDKQVLLEKEYHMVLLDEAQFIKNAQAKMTQIVQQFKANHRLCLTGTPIENNLGELWSLFHFLMPGLLGNRQEFKAKFRNPIEKQQDKNQQELLSALIKPFILRRTKDEVVKDLPEKTEIIHYVELNKQQRDLYESIRLAMHKKVQQEIDKKGVERSQIIILDALLKLRQICCDPRLLKMDAAKDVKASEKLNELMVMLEELLGEGRRILLFSQFTSMLALIEDELKAKGIEYLKLIGSTKDRMTPVKQFQEGKTPLFLISLKSGGTGLNLTRADTVIHYDPWWNPAVEQQASDRAHRIGQTQSVFVYKLVTTGTVEEKILEMQKKKKSLVDALFSGKKHSGKITKSDLDIIFS